METRRNGDGQYVFGSYVFDTRADLLLKGGLRIKLQPKPRAVLRELLSRPGDLVTRERLRDVLWPDGTFVDFDLGLNVAIKKLRDALCDSPDTPVYIETAPGEGYRFIAPVEYICPPPAANVPVSVGSSDNGYRTETIEAAVGAPTDPIPAPIASQPGWAARLWGVGALVLAVLFAMAASRWRRIEFRPIAVHQLTWNAIGKPVLDASISPSGKLIAFVDAQGVAVQEIATGQSHRVAAPDAGASPQVSWGPDSNALIVCGGNGIWSVSLLGGSAKLHDALRPAPWAGCAAAMSPDRTHIAFLDADGIWMMGPNGEAAHRIVAKTTNDRLGGPTWSPDSTRIAYSLHRQTPAGVRATIETCDVNGGSPTTIPLEQTRIGKSRWTWLSDGRIIFSRPETAPYSYFVNLWEVRVDARTGRQIGEARRLTDFPDFRMARISGSDLGDRLTFLRPVNIGTVLAGEVSADGESSGPLREATNDEASNRPVGWDGEGNGVYILSNRGRTTSLYRLREQATNTIEAPALEFAQLVGGGQTLIYGIETPRLYSIYRRPLSGGSAELILKTEVELDFRCAASAETCVIVDKAGDKLRLSAFSAVTGERHDLATIPQTADPAWSLSPDGTRLAVIRLDDVSAKKIDILDVASGKRLRRIDVNADGLLADIGWAGPHALVVTAMAKGGGCDVFRIDVQGGQHLLWHDPRWLGSMSVSPDGRHVALSASVSKVNAWMAENF